MEKQVRGDSFRAARGFVANVETGAALLVCDEYELHLDVVRTGEIGRPVHYLLPKRYPRYPVHPWWGSPDFEEDGWHLYRPLEEDPDLFLEFARLYDGERSPEVALRWANEHAPLSCTLGYETNRSSFRATGISTREYVDDFFEEVDRAATVLKLYEGVSKRSELGVLETITEGPSPFVEQYYTDLFRVNPESDDMMVFGYFALMLEVSRMVRTFAYPHLAVFSDFPLVSRITEGWGFDSLLGAMYLQMYWLLAAGSGNVAYCKFCGKLISLTTRTARPGADGKPRKTRQDKRYCDNRCQQRHYYHTKEKYRRKSRQKKESE